jgi:hypothetical protein
MQITLMTYTTVPLTPNLIYYFPFSQVAPQERLQKHSACFSINYEREQTAARKADRDSPPPVATCYFTYPLIAIMTNSIAF